MDNGTGNTKGFIVKQKQCSKCSKVKTLDQYYRDRSRKDGFANSCKVCAKKKNDDWRRNNPDYMRNYAQNWSRDTYQNSQQSKYAYRKKYPNRTKAWRAVNNAVAIGLLPHVKKLSCHDCKEPAQHYHHESYKEEDWLNVIPLCQSCHKQKHAEPI